MDLSNSVSDCMCPKEQAIFPPLFLTSLLLYLQDSRFSSCYLNDHELQEEEKQLFQGILPQLQ